MYNGILVFNKPEDFTSHDAVAKLRGILRQKKIGHAGTLDPIATGVLPVFLGRATRAVEYAADGAKEYHAVLRLGTVTDTQDSTGTVLETNSVSVTAADVEAVLPRFRGEIEQIPPMFSAIKQGGKKLYELARTGVSVERKPRRIEIYKIDIHEIDTENYTATFSVYCSKGTYIRTLCEDIGMKLGCGAYMNTLRRIKSANFTLEEAYTTDELIKMKDAGTLEDAVIPVDKIFSDYDAVMLDDFLSQKAKNGVRIRKKGLEDGKLYRVYGENDGFLCISKYLNGELVLEKAFWN